MLTRPDHVFALRDFDSANASIRRAVLLEVGLFDDTFTQYGNEDLELWLRLRNAGVELRFDPDAVAEQSYTKTFAELAGDTFEKGQTAVLFASKHPEVFDGLQLATYHTVSGRWMGARAGLLALGRTWPRGRRWLLRLAEALERAPAFPHPLMYRFVLDYFYWAGVEEALYGPPLADPMARLAADIRRGPIGLLLHR
jgi:GT2 family glycosyltransferase